MSLHDYRAEAEKTGICMECETPRMPRYLCCEKCAEGLTVEDLEFDCVIPSLVEAERKAA